MSIPTVIFQFADYGFNPATLDSIQLTATGSNPLTYSHAIIPSIPTKYDLDKSGVLSASLVPSSYIVNFIDSYKRYNPWYIVVPDSTGSYYAANLKVDHAVAVANVITASFLKGIAQDTNGNQILNVQQSNVANATTTGSCISQLNLLLSALRVHGLISSS